MERLPETRVVARSSLYRSPPMGPADQPDYINAVAALDTGLPPEALLSALQVIERAHGRRRGGQRWGPRPLDLDVLLYGEAPYSSPTLTIPHPGLHDRAFVLYPLREIAGNLQIPGLGALDALVARCVPDGLERLDGNETR